MMAITGTAAAYIAVSGASQQFATTMQEGETYVLVSTIAAWVALGTNPTAVGRAAGATYLPPNFPLEVRGGAGVTKVAIIQDAAAGHASLTRTA